MVEEVLRFFTCKTSNTRVQYLFPSPAVDSKWKCTSNLASKCYYLSTKIESTLTFTLTFCTMAHFRRIIVWNYYWLEKMYFPTLTEVSTFSDEWVSVTDLSALKHLFCPACDPCRENHTAWIYVSNADALWRDLGCECSVFGSYFSRPAFPLVVHAGLLKGEILFHK